MSLPYFAPGLDGTSAPGVAPAGNPLLTSSSGSSKYQSRGTSSRLRVRLGETFNFEFVTSELCTWCIDPLLNFATHSLLFAIVGWWEEEEAGVSESTHGPLLSSAKVLASTTQTKWFFKRCKCTAWECRIFEWTNKTSQSIILHFR